MLLLYSLPVSLPVGGMLLQPPPLTTWHAAPLSSPYLELSMLLLYPLPLLGDTMLLVYPIPTWWRHTAPLSSPYL
jgi:hypothetical protein